MHESLISYIKRLSETPMTERDIQLVKEAFVSKKLRKRQYFLQAGEVCKHMAFIVKGAMRQYSVDDKGAEHMVRLSLENWWAGDRESFTMLTPSIYNVDAWEESEVLIITKADMTSVSSIPALDEMARQLDNNHAFALQKRVNSTISDPIDKRYAELSKSYPQLLERFPQHLIASYLGVTKETLSRIRHHLVKKLFFLLF
jgi:CRP-like cAMP-binding protein